VCGVFHTGGPVQLAVILLDDNPTLFIGEPGVFLAQFLLDREKQLGVIERLVEDGEYSQFLELLLHSFQVFPRDDDNSDVFKSALIGVN
jgi:hypothetical protein